MIFAFSTDDRSLMSFASQSDAISYAEGIDVEEGIWRFFGKDGVELKPVFTVPNQKAGFVVMSGNYFLIPSSESTLGLPGIISEVRSYEGIIKSEAELLSVLAAHWRAGAAQQAVQRDGPASGGSTR